VTGAALADDHHQVEFGRAHGDTIDKSYRAQRVDSHVSANAERTATATRSVVQQKQSERVNCSSEGADCGASHGSAARGGSGASGGADKRPSIHSQAAIAVSERVGKSDRTQCDEAGEGCQMSSKATKAGSKGHGASPTEATPMAQAAMAAVDRKLNQAYAARMSCNEGDQCSMSSKDAAKIWRTESFKHGVAGDKSLDFSNAHADLKSKMEKSRYKSENEAKKH
jgi:hypothetical protein